MHDQTQDFPPGHRCVIDLNDPPADIPKDFVEAAQKMFAAVFSPDQESTISEN